MRHPLAKFVLLCAFAVAVVSAPGLIAKGGLVALVFLSGRKRLFSRRLFRLSITFGIFLLVVQALLTPGQVIARLGPVAVTAEGLKTGGEMALRFLGIVGGSFLFVATTPPEEIATSLSQTRIPYRYTHILVLALRFLPLFQEEYQRIREAQVLRGLALRPWNLVSHLRWTMVPVMASALSRADGLALAMQGRAFGRFPRRTHLMTIPWRMADSFLLILAILGFALSGWFMAGGGAKWP